VRGPVRIILFSFRIRTCDLSKIAVQLSSHNWESETSVPVLSASRTNADCDLSLRSGDSGSVPESVGVMMSPLAEITVGPSVTVMALRRYFASFEETKVPVAPESRITVGLQLGGTTTVETGRDVECSILVSTVVPDRQAGVNQKQLAVLPPCMLVEMAVT
jgi:hypothetical protein